MTLLRYIAQVAQWGCRINTTKVVRIYMHDSQASSSILSLRIPGCRTEAPKEVKRDGLSELNKLVGPRLGVRQPRISLTFHSEKQFVH